ncbi:MAG: hypothetical protein LBK71_01360 [Verrucomicrobiales bacterium]|jgi:hypothetical protein|nr:hypothetical protein [Verrucomicrobiales bacterium]MDR1304988.1 hypothetical protein [Verrucomicrobiales bacterium]
MNTKRMGSRLARLGGLLLLPLMFSGCSTIASRVAEREQAFNLLTKEQQRIVMQGRISEGLSKDGVYIALGRPLRVLREQMDGITSESWVYGRMETYATMRPAWPSPYPFRYGYGPYFYPYPYDAEVSVMRDTFVVYFNQAGKVKGWKEL